MSGLSYAEALARVDWIEPDEARAEIANAGVVEWEGGLWLAKTDGKVALAVRLAGTDALMLGTPHPIADKIAGLLDEPFAALPWHTTADALRAAVGEPEPWTLCEVCEGMGGEECERCDGDGQVDCECRCGDQHERECADCDGTGSQPCTSCGERKREYPADPPASPVFIRSSDLRTCFNRRILSPLLAHLAGPLEWMQTGEFHGARLSGDGWIAVVMPMRNQQMGGCPVVELSELTAV